MHFGHFDQMHFGHFGQMHVGQMPIGELSGGQCLSKSAFQPKDLK